VSISSTANGFALPRPPNRSWQAFASALGLEAALLGIAIAWLVTHPPQPPEKVVPITIEQVVEPPVQKTVLPEPEKIKPPPPPPVVRPLPAPVQTVKPPPIARPLPVSAPVPAPSPAAPLPQSASVVPSPPVPSPVPVPDPVAPPPTPPTAYTVPAAPAARPLAPPPPPPVAATVDPSPAYNAKLAAAVQAVFEVPAAAAALDFKGRTRVEFSLRDGVVSAVRVIQTSGLGAADRAAIKAVQAAVYPAPPAPLQGKENSYQIWVACL
jgi:periplasmic protein TonB